MKKIQIARLVVQHSTAFGASMATTSLIKNNMRRHPNTLVRGCQYMGMFGISGAVSDVASKWALKQFDELVEAFQSDTSTPTKN